MYFIIKVIQIIYVLYYVYEIYRKPLTWAEENDGLHAGEFRGIDHDCLISLQGIVQVPDIRRYLTGFTRGGL